MRPFAPQTSALTGLRYAPTPARACVPYISAIDDASAVSLGSEQIGTEWTVRDRKVPPKVPPGFALRTKHFEADE